jgi:hypothetical protein
VALGLCKEIRGRANIERAELDFVVVPAGVERIEIRDPIDAQDYGLSVDHKLVDAVFQGGRSAL